MAAKITLTSEFIVAAMQSQVVRDALQERAYEIVNRADAIAASEGVDVETDVTTGTRPKGRPYARVLADAEQEWGSTYMDRRRILGRAAEGS
jgi:hypothetical protein